MGFTNYFLVVWDFVKFARDNGILVGPGRGSGRGQHRHLFARHHRPRSAQIRLIFERFLNPSRIHDAGHRHRLRRRPALRGDRLRCPQIGDDRVAQIVTLGTLAAKALDPRRRPGDGDVFAETDRVAKLIPTDLASPSTARWKRCRRLKTLYDQEPQLRELIDSARKVEGIARHSSTHAAGRRHLARSARRARPPPTRRRQERGRNHDQYPMSRLEELGLLKMDFLGLSTLTIRRQGRRAGAPQESRPDPGEPCRSTTQKSYELLCRG
jgi:DNA polymerase-3 subunit alpha